MAVSLRNSAGSAKRTTKEIREWAIGEGRDVSPRGRVSAEIEQAFHDAQTKKVQAEAMPAKKTPVKKVVAEKAPAGKTVAKKAPAAKTAGEKTAAEKMVARKAKAKAKATVAESAAEATAVKRLR